MADSTCLLRSLSNPTAISLVAKEGDPICAKLGESISFGRFMSESLAWEKWSAFSHNRYVEEAEKFSRPGSVAEKKAYFEAHYREKAAERSAALIQEANDSANRTSDSEAQDGTCNNSSTEIKSKADSNVAVVEQRDNDAVNCIVDYADENKYKSNIEQNEVDISRVERSEDVPEPRVDMNPSVENSSLVYNSNQFVNVEVNKKIAIHKEDRMPDPGPTGEEIQALSVRRREVTSSLKLPSKTGAAKLSYSLAERKAAVQAEDRINSALGSKKSAGGSFEKKRLIARSLHMSINLPSSVGVKSKTTSVSEQNRIKKVNPNLPKIPKGARIEASSNPQSEGKSFLKSSSATSINPRLSTTSFPFKLRSEERAAKRKEFFQRLDEIKSQEAEKVQVQERRKKKTKHDPKKLQQNSGSKSKPNTNINDGSQSLSDVIRKVLVTPPRSLNLGRKASPRKLRKPPNPITTTTNNIKRVAEKINQRTRHSITPLVRKITRENASPNIQP
ncbi:hypothetical protein L6164_015133 [Bauhinia variegata]|uniref:Uncharacterized protein n=1 Tax=Bauhinia variegata TaxID=167791 RepID=A0ACB9NKN8_BAUVA|nr:hypothetical protein L6164_015133 [Bauhinia variegata]